MKNESRLLWLSALMALVILIIPNYKSSEGAKGANNYDCPQGQFYSEAKDSFMIRYGQYVQDRERTEKSAKLKNRWLESQSIKVENPASPMAWRSCAYL